MNVIKYYILLPAFCIIFIFFGSLTGCVKSPEPFDINSVKTYRDIPGITEEEITAIEKLKSQRKSFSYGQMSETEAFILPDGTYSGFAIEFSKLLSSLFETEFVFEFHKLEALITGLGEHRIDFTGDLNTTPERRQRFFMSHSIAERSQRIYTLKDNHSIITEQDTAGLQIGYLKGSVDAFRITHFYPDLKIKFTAVDSIDTAVKMMKAGEISAFASAGVLDPQFAPYYDIIKSKEFFPLVYTAVSFTTANPELVPFIEVVDKYLAAGGVDLLYDLYLKCGFNYEKNKLHNSFTKDELIYLNSLTSNNRPVKIGLQSENYPISFYNRAEKRFEGIACDILDEISRLLDIEFEVVNSPDTNWPELFEMLKKGEITLVSQLLHSSDRSGAFLWSDMPYAKNRYALISKQDYPDLANFQVIRTKVGTIKDSAYEEKYNEWFPDNTNLVTYERVTDALNALETGEVDLLMGSDYILLMQHNYYEKPGFKINIPFHTPLESYFGFNMHQKRLCSIVCKALEHINTDRIENTWTSRGYDYVSRLSHQRMIYVLVITIITILLLIRLAFFNRRLNKLVKVRTENLEKQTIAAQAAAHAKSIFLASMSHEIRTPMNAILGITEIQLQNASIPAETQEAFENIYESGNLLLHIINDILDLSKIDAGKLEIAPDKYDIPSLINDTVHINIMRYEVKPIKFHLNIEPDTPLNLVGDEFRIKQVLNNILSNAFKYTEKGNIELSIFSEPTQKKNRIILVIRISDTGQGLRKDQLERLFDEYSRFNMETNQGITGTGLGMSITKRLVDLMKGKIEVESEPGKGSVFTVRIPQKKSGNAVCGAELADKIRNYEYQSKSITKRTYIAKQNMSYGNVLIVDDVSSNLYVAKGLLLPYGLKIDTAQSGMEAIEKIKNGNVYDLIFMDHMMPKMDGIEAVIILRGMGYKNPIVALTANAIVGQEGIFLENGFDGFISKPIDSRELDQVLTNFIHNRKSPEERITAPTLTEGKKQSVTELRKFFVIDSESAVTVLERFIGSDNKDTEIDAYEIAVHGMKSALGNVGEQELSAVALKLEKAAKEKDFDTMTKETPAFLEALKLLIIKYRPSHAKEIISGSAVDLLNKDEALFLKDKFLEIKAACDVYDTSAIKAAIEELNNKTWPQEVSDIIDELNVYLLHSSFKKIIDEINSFVKHFNGRDTNEKE